MYLPNNLEIHQVISPVIRQKGESQNGCLKKTKYAKFSEKRTFLTPCTLLTRPIYRHFFGQFGVPCFLQTPVLRFALLPYYRRYIGLVKVLNIHIMLKEIYIWVTRFT